MCVGCSCLECLECLECLGDKSSVSSLLGDWSTEVCALGLEEEKEGWSMFFACLTVFDLYNYRVRVTCLSARLNVFAKLK